MLVLAAVLLLLAGGGTAMALLRGDGHRSSASGTSSASRTSGSASGSSRTPTASASVQRSAEPVASLATPTLGTSMSLGGTPQYAHTSPDGRFVYVTDPAAGTVIRVDTTTDAVTATIPVPQGPPQWLSFSADGTRAFVSVYSADYGASSVVYLDTATNTVTNAVAVDPGPYAISPSPDGRTLYVPLYLQPRMDVVDIASATLVGRIDAPANPHPPLTDWVGSRVLARSVSVVVGSPGWGTVRRSPDRVVGRAAYPQVG